MLLVDVVAAARLTGLGSRAKDAGRGLHTLFRFNQAHLCKGVLQPLAGTT